MISQLIMNSTESQTLAGWVHGSKFSGVFKKQNYKNKENINQIVTLLVKHHSLELFIYYFMLHSSLFFLLLILKYNFLKDEARKTLKSVNLGIEIHSKCNSTNPLNLRATPQIFFGKGLFEKLVKNMLGSSFFSFYIYQVIHIRDDVYIKIFKKGITLQNLYGGVDFLDSVMKVFKQIIKQLT